MIGQALDLNADELGIGAIMFMEDAAARIQVVNFLPACNHCKRITKPALLKRCSRCKLATYCTKECQVADWVPHHKLVCKNVGMWTKVYKKDDKGNVITSHTSSSTIFDFGAHNQPHF